MAILFTWRHARRASMDFSHDSSSTSSQFRCFVVPLPKKWLILIIFNIAGIFIFHFIIHSASKAFPRFYFFHGANETIWKQKPYLSKSHLTFHIQYTKKRKKEKNNFWEYRVIKFHLPILEDVCWFCILNWRLEIQLWRKMLKSFLKINAVNAFCRQTPRQLRWANLNR